MSRRRSLYKLAAIVAAIVILFGGRVLWNYLHRPMFCNTFALGEWGIVPTWHWYPGPTIDQMDNGMDFDFRANVIVCWIGWNGVGHITEVRDGSLIISLNDQTKTVSCPFNVNQIVTVDARTGTFESNNLMPGKAQSIFNAILAQRVRDVRVLLRSEINSRTKLWD